MNSAPLHHHDAQDAVRSQFRPILRFSHESVLLVNCPLATKQDTDMKVDAEGWERNTNDESLLDADASEALGETFQCLNDVHDAMASHAMASQAKASFEKIQWRQTPAVALQRIGNDEIASAKASFQHIQWRQAPAVAMQPIDSDDPRTRILRQGVVCKHLVTTAPAVALNESITMKSHGNG